MGVGVMRGGTNMNQRGLQDVLATSYQVASSLLDLVQLASLRELPSRHLPP